MGVHKLTVLICSLLFIYVADGQDLHKKERTLGIIKPIAFKKAQQILQIIKRHNFKIVAMKKMNMSYAQAEELYHLYKNQPLFAKIVKYISSGPVVVMMLQKDNAVKDWRALIGAPDPEKAAQGTLRYMFSKSKVKNAAHGSDSIKAAQAELHLFFPELV